MNIEAQKEMILNQIANNGFCYCYYDIQKAAKELEAEGKIQKQKMPRRVPEWVAV